MTTELDPSPQMLAALANTKDTKSSKSYPWDTINLYKSFTIPYSQMAYKTLIPYASRMGKKLGKKFKVLKHDDPQLYEVYRMDDPVEVKEEVGPIAPIKINEPDKPKPNFNFKDE